MDESLEEKLERLRRRMQRPRIEPSSRVICRVQYRLTDDPDRWPIASGRPGGGFEEVVENLRRRYGDRLIEVHPYRRRIGG